MKRVNNLWCALVVYAQTSPSQAKRNWVVGSARREKRRRALAAFGLLYVSLLAVRYSRLIRGLLRTKCGWAICRRAGVAFIIGTFMRALGPAVAQIDDGHVPCSHV